MIETKEQNEESKTRFQTFRGEYDILGIKVKAKPMKLRLQKETCIFTARLMKHVKDITGFDMGDAKNSGELFLCGMSILGFLSEGNNLAECLALFTESSTDWKRFIEENGDCYEMILDSAGMILSDFFLSTGKFIIKRISF